MSENEAPPENLPYTEEEVTKLKRAPPKPHTPHKKLAWVWCLVKGPYEGTTDFKQGRKRKNEDAPKKILLCILGDYDGRVMNHSTLTGSVLVLNVNSNFVVHTLYGPSFAR